MSSGGGARPMGRQASVNRQCVICCHEGDYFCKGQCDHPVCFECGVRMRVVCDCRECPICRAELAQVWVVASPSTPLGQLRGAGVGGQDALALKSGIRFELKDALMAFRDLVAHVCTVCSNEPEFKSFGELGQHMRREHQLYYCDICAKHLKLFSWERKCYTRENLALHRRQGDSDDKSHRGHPLCTYCDERFLDDDLLYQHLMREHHYCHFCNADGQNLFYREYAELRNHFKSQHYFCDEGDCINEQYTNVFRTEIDFKSHRSKQHSTKRQERRIDINFSYGDNPSQQFRGRGRGRGGGGGGGSRSSAATGPPPPTSQPEEEVVQPSRPLRAPTASRITTVRREELVRAAEAKAEGDEQPSFAMQQMDFPSLAGDRRNASFPVLSAAAAAAVGRPRKPFGLRRRSESLDENEFPALAEDERATAREPAVRRRQPSPPERGGLVMIDDDEHCASATEQQQLDAAMLNEAAAAAATEPAQPRQPTAYESLTSGAWSQQRPTSLGQAALSLRGAEDFPSLHGGGRLRGQRQAPTSRRQPGAWAAAAAQPPLDSRKPPKEAPIVAPASASLTKLPVGKSKARKVAHERQRSVETAASSAVDNGRPPPGLAAPTAQFTASSVGPYIRPADFDARNRKLFERLGQTLASDTQLQDFKMLSGMYRRGEIGADYYCQQVASLVGVDAFGRLFAELVCLLPDVKRQRSLLEAEAAWTQRQGGVVSKDRRLMTDAQTRRFALCRLCGQVLAHADFSAHSASHSMQTDFPSLS